MSALRNPAALRSTNDRALELKAQGRLDEAVPLLREALAGRREVLGLHHADTLYSATQLALLLQDQGKISEAEPLLREARDSYIAVNGTDHPDSLSSSNYLALLLKRERSLSTLWWASANASTSRRSATSSR